MHEPGRILLTGATGFVGSHILKNLVHQRMTVRVALRHGDDATHVPAGVEVAVVGDLGPGTVWDEALQGVDVVLHVAGVAAAGNDDALRRVNVQSTVQLARSAADKGVKRLVFMSSLKVNGEVTLSGQVFGPLSPVDPQDAYARSKLQAEEALQSLAQTTGMALVIIRPPMVYGSGVKGNFLALLKLVQKGIPLPLASVKNQRSLIAVENLADFSVRACVHPHAKGVYLVADGEPISTPNLLRTLALSMGTPARLWPFPVSWMKALGACLGVGAALSKLTDDLVLDHRQSAQALDWHPPISTAQGVDSVVAWYQEVMC
jgi:nucleoside-diphosphate-sugar epimerase